jgi:hypothetical protein
MDRESNEMETENYLNDPLVVEKFNKNYLSSLQIYLDDKSYAYKISQLPGLKSATTVKYEKMVEKEHEMKKKRKNSELNKELSGVIIKEKEVQTEKSKNKLKNFRSSTKNSQMRYLILDPENRHIDLTNIEENYEYNKKLINPYKTLLVEDSDKIRKQAIEQILDNALNREKKKERTIQNSTTNLPKESSLSSKIVNNIQNMSSSNSFLLNKLKSHENRTLNLEETKEKESFNNFMRVFKESCELNNLITIDQKIDYYVHLKTNMQSKKESPERISKYPMKNVQSLPPNLSYKKLFKNSTNNQTIKDPSFIPSILKGSNNDDNISHNKDQVSNQYILGNLIDKELSKKESFAAGRSKSINTDMFYKYISELKTKFKLTEDAQSIKFWEFYYNELMIKVSSYKSQYRSIASEGINLSYIEKIKQIINCKEISQEKVILRDSEMSPDKLYYLVAKRVFDFKHIQVRIKYKNLK